MPLVRICRAAALLAMTIFSVPANYCVYILTNQRYTVLNTEVTSDLKRRVHQHREKLLQGFAYRYSVSKLVYYESTEDVSAAIARERQIKAGSRRKKIALVNAFNPEWRELYDEL
jgi:putative endonuclease